MQKKMYETRNTDKNKDLANVIKSGLVDLENEIEEMSKIGTEIENPYEIVDIVERILYFNNWNREGQGLKTLTPDQTLNRLPIALIHLKAGNNSEKLKNETILIYSFASFRKID